jgi:hypothetical protein
MDVPSQKNPICACLWNWVKVKAPEGRKLTTFVDDKFIVAIYAGSDLRIAMVIKTPFAFPNILIMDGARQAPLSGPEGMPIQSE